MLIMTLTESRSMAIVYGYVNQLLINSNLTQKEFKVFTSLHIFCKSCFGKYTTVYLIKDNLYFIQNKMLRIVVVSNRIKQPHYFLNFRHAFTNRKIAWYCLIVVYSTIYWQWEKSFVQSLVSTGNPFQSTKKWSTLCIMLSSLSERL